MPGEELDPVVEKVAKLPAPSMAPKSPPIGLPFTSADTSFTVGVQPVNRQESPTYTCWPETPASNVASEVNATFSPSMAGFELSACPGAPF